MDYFLWMIHDYVHVGNRGNAIWY